MTITTSNRFTFILFLGLASLIILTELFVLRTMNFRNHPDIFSLAITLDIVLVIPILYYFIVVRKFKLHVITTIPAFIICIGIASYILPKENNNYLELIKKGLIFIELFILSIAFIKIRKIIKIYKQLSVYRNDFPGNLKEAFEKVFGYLNVINIFVSEICTIRYGLFFWIGRKEVLKEQKCFSIHKRTGFIQVMSIIFFVAALETALAHFLLWNWNKNIALIITILSVYGIIFIIADFVAILKRPILFYQDQLWLRIGIRFNTIVNPNQIESIESIKRFIKDKDSIDCSLLRSPNILITLNEPIIIFSYYGIKKKARRIAINIDNPTEFFEELNLYR